MDALAERFKRFTHQYTDWLLDHRWRVIAAALVVVLAASYGAGRLTFKDDYRVWFRADNPQLIAWDKLQDTYTKNENVLLVVAPRDPAADVFSVDALTAVHALTAGGWQVPFSIRVDSITNFQHSRASGDDLVVEDLVRDPTTLTPAELAAKRAIALDEVLLRDRLIAADGRATGVNITLQMPHERGDEVPRVAAAVRELAARIRSAHPELEVRLTGTVMMNAAFSESSRNDGKTLIPLMLLAVVVALAVMLRSPAAVGATVGVILMSIGVAMGLAGWAGIKLTPPSATAPVVIMTLAVADSIHLLIAYFSARRRGLEDRAAWHDSMSNNMMPVFLTSLTTSVGFLTLNSSDAPPFGDMGNITATGVVVAWLLSITFLPAAISLLRIRVPRTETDFELTLDRFAGWVVTWRKPLLTAWIVVAAVLIAMIPRNELDDQFVKYFDQRIEFRRDTDFVLEHLTGVYPIQFSLPAGGSGAVAEPVYLEKVEAFATWLRGQPEVVHVAAITDVFKRLNKNMHGDDPAWARLPGDRELAAQYLLLYEMSLPFGLDLNNQVDVDKSATQVVVTLRDVSMTQVRAFALRAEDWLTREAPALQTHGVSPTVMFAHISKTNIDSMLVGTFWGLVVISAILVIALRSVSIGLISLIPNLLPTAMVFGLWGLWVGQINMAVSVIAATSLGIVVDDTVHFLTKYLRARREQGMSAEQAVHYAFTGVGVALIVMTVVLVTGFGILGLSSFQVNSYMGLLTASGIAIAAVAEFTMLPPLLIALDRKQRGPRTAPRGGPGAVLLAIGVATLAIAMPSSAQAASTVDAAVARGLEIATEADRRDQGFKDSLVTLRMTLRNRQGDSSVRNLRTRALEVAGDGDKSLITFDTPADVKGTALLSFTHKSGPDDQWLFLPALKRVKRIASDNKAGPFMGSEFAYEDLSSQEVEKYRYLFLREESVAGQPMFVIERQPVDPRSGYTRQVLWMDQAELRAWKVEYYDRKASLLKTLTAAGFEQHLGKHWRPTALTMVNHQTGKSTVLEFSDYRFATGLKDRDFDQNALLNAK